jgi:hypothetical protein
VEIDDWVKEIDDCDGEMRIKEEEIDNCLEEIECWVVEIDDLEKEI